MTLHIYYDERHQEFVWKLHDGPDGIEYAQGAEDSLLECFLAVERARTEIAHQYA